MEVGGLHIERKTCPFMDNTSPLPLLGSLWAQPSKAAFLLSPPREVTLGRGNKVLGGFWEGSELPGAPCIGRAEGLASLSAWEQAAG